MKQKIISPDNSTECLPLYNNTCNKYKDCCSKNCNNSVCSILSNSNSKLISDDPSNAKNKIEYTQEDLKQANELKEKFRERCINELVEGSSYEFNQLAQLKSKCENEFWFKNFITHMCSKTDEISKKAVP